MRENCIVYPIRTEEVSLQMGHSPSKGKGTGWKAVLVQQLR